MRLDEIKEISNGVTAESPAYTPGTFSAVYVEKAARNHPRTEMILSRLGAREKRLEIKEINSYKDVFYNSSCGRALILARKKDHFVFHGAPVCQFFDEKHFYYATSAMNCLYDCEYCYLKGMYPSSHIVIYVNPEDTFAELDRMLEEHPMYVCISYDTDLPALEGLTGLVSEWAEYAVTRPKLRIECRTKCSRSDLWDRLPVNSNFILAFTLSPDIVTDSFEHHTASLGARLDSIEKAMTAGHPVRLCFDPVIHLKEWEKVYGTMLDEVRGRIDLSGVRDVSVGTFRISQDYLKRMRRLLPESPPVQFPFDIEEGVCVYPEYLRRKMTDFIIDRLSEAVPRERIYTVN